ncbi:MAG TPA: phage baseplate assembly protein V [Bryobacteraceae bacterium]
MAIVNGVVAGIVTAVDVGVVKVNFPWLDAQHETDWIRIATMMSGGNAGSFFMPNVQDEVLVAFEHGDTRFPYVVGFTWNGQDIAPGTDVRDRKLVSKNGHQIRFLDSTPSGGSTGAIVIEDASGNRITLSDGKIVVQSKFMIEIEAPAIYLQGPDLNPDSSGPPQRAWKRRVLPNNNAI